MVAGAPLGCKNVTVPMRLQFVHSAVPITVHCGSRRWRMPKDTLSGTLTVVLTAPRVLTKGGAGSGGNPVVVLSVALTFWLMPERQPRPIVVVGVGVNVTPAVAP